MPVLLAPVGYLRVMNPDGEIAAARAAGKNGVGFILSTVSGHRLEDVKAASTGQVWYQLYLTGGRAAAESAMRRAMDVGYTVLVITIDSTVIGYREREVRDGMEQLLRGNVWSRIPFVPQIFARPGWLARFLLDGGLPIMPNIVSPRTGALQVRDAHTAMKREAFSWYDMPWIRALWKGPIVIKGVLSAEDAKRSLDHGAAAVVVSNHGGRQLDGVPASLQALPEVVAAVKATLMSCWIAGSVGDQTSSKRYAWVPAPYSVDVPTLMDSPRLVKPALSVRSIYCALIWKGASDCWAVLLLTS
jgi:L-lactate dehydrogenase (cytochrome)